MPFSADSFLIGICFLVCRPRGRMGGASVDVSFEGEDCAFFFEDEKR